MLRNKPGRARRSVAAAVAGVAAVVVVGIPAPWLREHPYPLGAFVVALAAVLAVAWWSGVDRARRIALTAAAVPVPVLVFGKEIWPLPLLLAVAVWWLAGRYLRADRPVWLKSGRLGVEIVLLMLATATVSAVALAVWAQLGDPDAGPYLGGLRDRPAAVALLGILAFSLANSAMEEAVFRGVFQTELNGLVPAAAAIAAQAVGFGLLHMTGFPSGWLGVLLATAYGLLVGLIRFRARGMLAPYLTHVLADLTIGVIAIWLL